MMEFEDQVFLSGPFVTEGQLVGEGMTVLHASSAEEAARFMENEPFIKRGLRRFELKVWELREGTVSIRTKLSERHDLDNFSVLDQLQPHDYIGCAPLLRGQFKNP
jgi:hypothetical protein